MDSVTEESFGLGSLRFREEHLPKRNDFNIHPFSHYNAFGAPCGGALAFAKSFSSQLMVDFNHYKVDIYTAYGDFISSINLKDWKDIKLMGWTLSEHFIVVYSEYQADFASSSMGRIEVFGIDSEYKGSYVVPTV